MSDPVLFDVPPRACEFCRTCVHRLAYRYPHTIISYCTKQKSNLTENGFKKIKSKDPSCPQYEREHSFGPRKESKPDALPANWEHGPLPETIKFICGE